MVEESQLIFRGHNASIDCTTMSTEEWFAAGIHPLCCIESLEPLEMLLVDLAL